MDSPSIGIRTSDLQRYLNSIWRRKWLILLVVAVSVAATVAVSKYLLTPRYQASAEILQRRSGIDKMLLGSDFFQQSYQPDREMQTAAELVTSPEVSGAVAYDLGDRLGGREPDSMVNVSVVKKADILRITATDTDPQLAADVANGFAAQYIAWRQRVDLETLQNARAPIEAQVAATPPEQQDTSNYRVLKDKLENLKLLESMQNSNFEFVRAATVPAKPVSPNPRNNGVMAFLLSMFGAMGIVVVAGHFDTRIRHTEEIEQEIDKPVLTSVPKYSSSDYGPLVTINNPSGACSEAFRLLKTNLSYIEPDREIKSIMVTSPEASEGKSSTIVNLAITMARSGQKVIVLDGDLRRPVLSQYMNLGNSIGLTNAIAGNHSLKETLQMIEAHDLMIKPGFEGQDSAFVNSLNGVKPIYCATAGPLPPNPGEIVASEKMRSLISEASEYSDIVLVDSPPLGVVGDAASLATKVDGVIIVVSLGKTRKKALATLRHFMDTVPCNVLGIVINQAGSSNSYGNAYSYTYTSDS